MFVVVAALAEQLPHLQPVHWAVSTGTTSDIPNLWAVSGGCQWKEKMSRAIFLSYPPVPKCGFFFFPPNLFWPKFRTPEQRLQMIGESGQRRLHVSRSSCCLRSMELLMPFGQRLPWPHHSCGQIFMFMHTYKLGYVIASLHKVQLKWWILYQILLLNTKHFLQSSHSSVTWSQWWAVVEYCNKRKNCWENCTNKGISFSDRRRRQLPINSSSLPQFLLEDLHFSLSWHQGFTNKGL